MVATDTMDESRTAYPDKGSSMLSTKSGQPMENQQAAVATLSAVTKRYGATTALNNLSLALHPGEVVALLGPNGAGKSTAVRMMLGPDRANGRRRTGLRSGSPQPSVARTDRRECCRSRASPRH